MRKYRLTEKGRKKICEASKRYYYKKNNKFHPIYNPNK